MPRFTRIKERVTNRTLLRKEAFRGSRNIAQEKVQRKRKLLNRKRRIQYRLGDITWRPRDEPMCTAGNVHDESGDRVRRVASGGSGQSTCSLKKRAGRPDRQAAAPGEDPSALPRVGSRTEHRPVFIRPRGTGPTTASNPSDESLGYSHRPPTGKIPEPSHIPSRHPTRPRDPARENLVLYW